MKYGWKKGTQRDSQLPCSACNSSRLKHHLLTCELSKFDLEVSEKKEKKWNPTVAFLQSHFSYHSRAFICQSEFQAHMDMVSLETSLSSCSSKHQPDWKWNSIRQKRQKCVCVWGGSNCSACLALCLYSFGVHRFPGFLPPSFTGNFLHFLPLSHCVCCLGYS